MSLAKLLARIDAGEFDRGKRRPDTSDTARYGAPVSVKPAPVLACTSDTSDTAQKDNPQSEAAPDSYAMPWQESVTVTKPAPLSAEDERTIRVWLASLGETQGAIGQDIETCKRHSDTKVWLLARAHIDVTARATLHTCGDCQCFTHDPEGGGGIGTCAITKAGHPPKDATGYPLCYPFMQRRCPDFVASEPLQ